MERADPHACATHYPDCKSFYSTAALKPENRTLSAEQQASDEQKRIREAFQAESERLRTISSHIEFDQHPAERNTKHTTECR
jgi:hypothetical protein